MIKKFLSHRMSDDTGTGNTKGTSVTPVGTVFELQIVVQGHEILLPTKTTVDLSFIGFMVLCSI